MGGRVPIVGLNSHRDEGFQGWIWGLVCFSDYGQSRRRALLGDYSKLAELTHYTRHV